MTQNPYEINAPEIVIYENDEEKPIWKGDAKRLSELVRDYYDIKDLRKIVSKTERSAYALLGFLSGLTASGAALAIFTWITT